MDSNESYTIGLKAIYHKGRLLTVRKSPLHGQAHLVFLPTHKANAEKPKELALSHCIQTE
jgi:hypothetical protein